MKIWFNQLKGKSGMINMANLFALAMVVYTVNAACYFVHHQPEVPEAAMKFRKF